MTDKLGKNEGGMMPQPTWHEVLDDKNAANEMEVLDHLASMGYIPDYPGLLGASGGLVERGLIEKNWDWPGENHHFALTLEGCNTLRIMCRRYGIPFSEAEMVLRRPFDGWLDGVCGLAGEENRMLLYLIVTGYVYDSPNAYELLQSLHSKHLIEPYASGAWSRTLEGRVVLRHILKALHWKEGAVAHG